MAAPVTASLVFGGAVLWMIIGLSVGIYSALRPRSLIDRAAMVFVLIGISALIVCTFVLPFTVGFLPLALLVFAFWAFGTWFGLPGQQTIVASLSSRIRGTMLAFNGSALNLGGVFGPIITGQILVAGGFDAAARWTSLVGLAALGVAWWRLPRLLPDEAPAAVEASTVVGS
jgi:predicted MFS family arabinose efflux permease